MSEKFYLYSGKTSEYNKNVFKNMGELNETKKVLYKGRWQEYTHSCMSEREIKEVIETTGDARIVGSGISLKEKTDVDSEIRYY